MPRGAASEQVLGLLRGHVRRLWGVAHGFGRQLNPAITKCARVALGLLTLEEKTSIGSQAR
eukprot:2201419-Prorocentrum_lima.AAC.1